MTRYLLACIAISLTATSAQFGPPRPTLLQPITLYYRSDVPAESANDCLADAPDRACASCREVADKISKWDLYGFRVTIQHGREDEPKVFREGCTITSLIGGGAVHVLGDKRPGYTIFDVDGDDLAVYNAGPTEVSFGQTTLRGGGSGQLTVDYNAKASLLPGMIFECAKVSHMNVHDNQAQLKILNTPYKVTCGAPQSHIFANMGAVFHENSLVELENEPDFPGGFIGVTNNAKAQFTSIKYTGNATGPRCAAQAGGVVNTYGAGPEALPGSFNIPPNGPGAECKY